MTFKTVTCAIVMGSALMFGGAAYADTMVGSTTVSDKDLPAVQARCDQLNDASMASLADNTKDTTDDSSAGKADASITNGVAKVDELAAATTASVDLGNITLEACKAAGLTK